MFKFKKRSIVMAATFAVFAVATTLQPVAADETASESVVGWAQNQLDKRFSFGAKGLDRYDCSGLVYRTFKETGFLDTIGGKYRTAQGLFNWFKNNDRITNTPEPGDLVTWGGATVKHVGIFIGYNATGKPMAISALINPYGVTIHKVNWLYTPLKAYLSVNLDGS